MITGKPSITELFKKVSKPYFAIYSRGQVDKGSPIYKSKTDEGVTVEDALIDFEEALQLLSAGEYTLIMNRSERVADRGGNRADFRITLDEGLANKTTEAVGAIPGMQQQTAPAFDYDAMMTKAKLMAVEEFKKLQTEKELEDHKAKVIDLEKRLTEAEKKVNDPWNKLADAVAPHAAPIIAGIIGNNPAGAAPALRVAGTGDTHVIDNDVPTEELVAQSQKIFEDFTDALQTARPNDWLQIMVKLTSVIKDQPNKFNTALTFL